MKTHLDMGEQIRIFCAICQHKKGSGAGWCEEDIKACNEEDCPLWYCRFGKPPKELIKEIGEEARAFFQRK